MSLVFGSREVAVGPTVGYQRGDAARPAYVSKGPAQKREEEEVASDVSCISTLLQKGGDGLVERGGFCLDARDNGSLASSESSSIGVGEDSSGAEEEDDVGGDDEVQSKFKGGLGFMDSLEESLPIKRGLSSFFGGKSKSFASLSDVTMVKDLVKPENRFNKRRRVLMACKTRLSKGAFCSPLNTSMPNLALEEEDTEREEEEKTVPSMAALPNPERKFRSFRSPRSFSFADLNDA